MATFVDTFNGAGPDLTWVSARGGNLPVTNGDGTASIAGTEWQYARADAAVTGSTDMYSEVHVDTATNLGGADRRIILLVRATQAEQTYYSAILSLTNGLLSFIEWAGAGAPVGGGPINGDVPVTVPATPFVFRFEAEGDELRGYFDDELVNTATRTGGPTGTRGGLGARDAGTNVRFDEFRVGALADLVPSGPPPGRFLIASM